MKQLWTIVAFGIMVAVGANLYYVCRLTQADYEIKLQDLAKVRQNIFESEYINAQLKARVAHLKTDAGVEEVAREKLGYIYPDETAYVVLPTPPARKQESTKFPVTNHLQAEESELFYKFVHLAFAPPAEEPAKPNKRLSRS